MSLISRFVVALFLGAVFAVAGCAHTGGPVPISAAAPVTVNEKISCYAQPKFFRSVKARELACDTGVVARVQEKLDEATNFGQCAPDSGDAFWRFLGALKIYRTCAASVRFPPELTRDLMAVASAFLADIEVGLGVGRDCGQELKAFQEAMQAPQLPQ